ncbi:MAG: PTS transporter subunit EIIA, partial [Desulfobacterales bacterium]|nr:PTS transporter subunit EIIA [Desulfobacterales bacterium]
MKLCEIIEEENIVAELKAKDKKGVLGELAEAIAKQEAIDRETLVKVLVERENLGTTGIGDGVAIPHGKIEE